MQVTVDLDICIVTLLWSKYQKLPGFDFKKTALVILDVYNIVVLQYELKTKQNKKSLKDIYLISINIV